MRLIDGDKLFESLLKDKITSGMQKARFLDLVRAAPTVGKDINAPSKWISVKDRLPEQAGCRCLVSAEYGDGKRIVFTAFTGYGEPRWWTYDITHMEKAMYADNHVHHNYHVTHWMPLPEPPKG